MKDYFFDLMDLTDFNIIGLITKYEVWKYFFLKKFFIYFYFRYLIINSLILMRNWNKI